MSLSSSYKRAEQDLEFLARDELWPVRLQLELLKPELIQQEEGIRSTIVVFGSSRFLDPVAAGERLAETRAHLARSPEDPARRRAVEFARRQVEPHGFTAVAPIRTSVEPAEAVRRAHRPEASRGAALLRPNLRQGFRLRRASADRSADAPEPRDGGPAAKAGQPWLPAKAGELADARRGRTDQPGGPPSLPLR